MSLEIRLICIQHPIKPGQKLLGAVIGMENDGNAIGWSDGADVVGSGDSSGDRGTLVFIVDSLKHGQTVGGRQGHVAAHLAGEIGRAALGGLEDNWSICITCSLERCYYS